MGLRYVRLIAFRNNNKQRFMLQITSIVTSGPFERYIHRIFYLKKISRY